MAATNGEAPHTNGVGNGPQVVSTASQLEIICGPLLNYRRMEDGKWFGSVLVVTKGGGKTQGFVPTLVLGKAAE